MMTTCLAAFARFARRSALPLLAGAALLAACDPTTDIDDHPDADGFVIESGGEELVRWMIGDPVASLQLDVASIYDVVITMLDAGGQPIPHEDDDDAGDDVVVTIQNTAIATWTPEGEEPGHDHEFLEVHGEIETLSVGSTQMTICLLHGTHCDFERSLDLVVQ